MRLLPLGLIGMLAAGCASGGTNASGPQAAAAAKRHLTHLPLDVAIDGDGYFIVRAPAGGYLFTRVGSFSVSDSGELANEEGYPLYPPVVVPDRDARIEIMPDGAVRVSVEGGVGKLLGQIALARFDSPGAVQRDGAYRTPRDADSIPITGKPGTKGLGTLLVGQVED